MMSYTIFIVEDDPIIAGSVRDFLTRYGYRVMTAADFERIPETVRELQPHLIILDVQLPYQDGFHLCREIRRHSSVPILFLSGRTGEMEQVLGMESGGDDYVTKPFHLEVLLAKVRAMLRRTYGEYASTEHPVHEQCWGDLCLRLNAAEMVWRGESQSLTKNEVKLLALLMEHADQVVSREECLTALWEDAAFVDDNTLTVNVTRLRKKLARWGIDDAIVTHRGWGYQLDTNRLVKKQ